ncbi:LysR family transcriptional regulator [Edaphobacillus lindanitolerans]|uniref:DNA-binding transcriptional regulator, LysR family n=1 Tax=Edaphobacillus lindanitolerans TaxID=550447 RepID=A0A1U7PJN1_9BACI|nr:LysR family transcriptional regulator [Edaphobacillus lindanitolerans]SIT68398.1 DNA-binding transcriptional regulator, LysR family [Edaphobacillus lindanitolerans]
MNINEFTIIKTLAAEGNMRKASDRLFISQPALSQRLRSIEKEWGVQLFIRSPKGLTPTPAGERVIQFSRETLARYEEVTETLQTMANKVHGTLKIACASIVGQTWLPEVLKEFITEHPDVKVSLMTGWSSEIVRALHDGESHIGIVRGHSDWKGSKIHLFRDHLFLVDRVIRSVEEIQETDRPFIQFKSDSDYYEEIREWWQRHFSSNPKRQITVDQIETCRQLALNGIGYAILPSITLTDVDSVNKIPLTDSDDRFELSRDTWLIGYEPAFSLPQVDAFRRIALQHAKKVI